MKIPRKGFTAHRTMPLGEADYLEMEEHPFRKDTVRVRHVVIKMDEVFAQKMRSRHRVNPGMRWQKIKLDKKGPYVVFLKTKYLMAQFTEVKS